MWLLIGGGIGVLVAIGLVVFWIEPLSVVGVIEWITPNILYRVRTERAVVALSFDDGPHPEFTGQVLEILGRYEAKATFFVIGERALRHPEIVVRIKAEGHEVGNHCFRNGTILGLSDEEFVGNLEKTERAIGLGDGAKLFRSPGGVAWGRQIRLARERGYTCVLGCAYPHDPMRPPVWYIRWLIEKNLVPGTIVILHDGIRDASRGVAALPGILEAGRERGLKFVSVGELIRVGRENGE